jgi:hypothetical protein
VDIAGRLHGLGRWQHEQAFRYTSRPSTAEFSRDFAAAVAAFQADVARTVDIPPSILAGADEVIE